ncbi:hypothetical protein A2707_06020 [Candidatus Saccharibacteria bacterium RIFCSPHIGHO2_01_FULL_45_15]|nr:MAG: hypothetical protein A2707_06020 [Candidatus Saccharibacteria bacterium RIFCSPHIGHO2_01_FULL_45_15]OGL29001.1 MAG: hypothetical protein A3C39_06245 [Candidatus Saccharibacteria bacterium RIFCSPHIGHO2_02_FULL_46_12]OGL32016.1 MAG: hypothetical protein A3E76_01965 [Candidatus Saccharibacteria bacterium RIFCSPHIGHO2_12_FULL_44_22]
MKKANTEQRQRSISAAIGSVRAEGLMPSVKTQKRLQDYANGKITASELRRVTVQEMKQSNRRTTIAE